MRDVLLSEFLPGEELIPNLQVIDIFSLIKFFVKLINCKIKLLETFYLKDSQREPVLVTLTNYRVIIKSLMFGDDVWVNNNYIIITFQLIIII